MSMPSTLYFEAGQAIRSTPSAQFGQPDDDGASSYEHMALYGDSGPSQPSYE